MTQNLKEIMMQLKGLYSRISLALLLISPSLYTMQESTLVAIDLPNNKKGDVARILASHSKNIEDELNAKFNKIGLKFIPLKASQLHLTLFEAPIGSQDMHELAKATQNGVRNMNDNSFHPLSFGTVKRMSNSIVVTLTDSGNTVAKTVADTINSAMGGKALPYEGHISIGRLKLTSQKSGQPTTQADKDEIEKILKDNPDLINELIAMPISKINSGDLNTFSLDRIYITRGGGNDAKEIASMLIRDIKNNVGTDKSLVKTVDKELK